MNIKPSEARLVSRAVQAAQTTINDGIISLPKTVIAKCTLLNDIAFDLQWTAKWFQLLANDLQQKLN